MYKFKSFRGIHMTLSLSRIKQQLQFYYKLLAWAILLSLQSLLTLPFMILRPKHVDNPLIFSMSHRRITWILGLEWQIRGEKYLKEDQACVVVANHQSFIDFSALSYLYPVMRKCIIIAKKSILYTGTFGLAVWLSGTVFIDRMKTKESMQTLEKASQRVRNEKLKMWLFAEGTRRNSGKIHDFKKGAFHVAIENQFPIIPVVFSSYYFFSYEEKRFDSGKIIVTALPAIPTTGLELKDIDALISKTRKSMAEVYQSVNEELKMAQRRKY